MTQCEMVLNHMKTFGSITDAEAYEVYGIRRLGARVYDLRQLGIPIDSVEVRNKNRFGKKVRYAKYSLKGAVLGGE